MAEPSRRARAATVGVLALAAVVLLTVVRGPVVLLAAATVGLAVGTVVVLVPLLRADPVDWDWHPSREQDVAPEPGIATLRRTLAPAAGDTGAADRLHALVRAVADDRAPHGDLGSGALAAYLAAPPRPATLDEVEVLVAELETLTPDLAPKETP